MQSATPTLARRYVFKLLANVASVPVYLAMEAILPRALGPRMYGNYSFATNLFQQLSGFLDMGTSTCFYNALSRRQEECGLIAFYLRVSLLVLGVSALAALCLQLPDVGGLLMPDVPLWLAPLAALWAFLTWWGRVLRSMNDAVGVTVSSELTRTVLSLLAVGLLGLLFWMDWLNIYSLFVQQYFMLGATALGYWLVTRAYWRSRSQVLSLTLTPAQTRAYGREFFAYSHPLFVQALLSFLLLSAERWLLQWFDGSVQQGFFALSQKVSMACFLFVSAMTPLIMRELSIAWGHNDRAAMACWTALPRCSMWWPLIFPALPWRKARLWCAFSAARSLPPPPCPCRSWPFTRCIRPTGSWRAPSSTPRGAPACCATWPPWNASMASARPGFCWPRPIFGAATLGLWAWPSRPWPCR